MKVKDLNGIEGHWSFEKRKKFQLKSTHHLEACGLIEKVWPTIKYLEEIPIKIKDGTTLYLDIYIPLLKKAVEVQGRQHFQINSKFHKSKFDLIKQKKNDILKEQWCILNQIEYIALPYNEKNEWRDLLINGRP